MVLLEAASRADPALLRRLHASRTALLTAAAAALWVSAKVMGVRGGIPSAALLAQASLQEAPEVIDFEVGLLKTLGWEVTATLRAAGILLT